MKLRNFWVGLAALVTTGAALADDAPTNRSMGFVGGGEWFYTVKGNVENGARLDFEDDLHLKPHRTGEVVVGFVPAAPRWFPALELSALRIGARGEQTVGTGSSFGDVLFPGGSVVETRADINDIDIAMRWGFPVGDQLRINGGLTVVALNGDVVVGNPQSGAEDREKISEVFPLVSTGLVYTPHPRVGIYSRFDYISQGENKAQTAEAGVVVGIWRGLGLEAGYRQRRFKVVNDDYRFDSRLGGARATLRYAF